MQKLLAHKCIHKETDKHGFCRDCCRLYNLQSAKSPQLANTAHRNTMAAVHQSIQHGNIHNVECSSTFQGVQVRHTQCHPRAAKKQHQPEAAASTSLSPSGLIDHLALILMQPQGHECQVLCSPAAAAAAGAAAVLRQANCEKPVGQSDGHFLGPVCSITETRALCHEPCALDSSLPSSALRQ